VTSWVGQGKSFTEKKRVKRMGFIGRFQIQGEGCREAHSISWQKTRISAEASKRGMRLNTAWWWNRKENSEVLALEALRILCASATHSDMRRYEDLNCNWPGPEEPHCTERGWGASPGWVKKLQSLAGRANTPSWHICASAEKNNVIKPASDGHWEIAAARSAKICAGRSKLWLPNHCFS